MIAVLVDHVEGGGRTEVDHDERPGEPEMRGECIDQPVRTDLLRTVDQRLHAEVDPFFADDQRFLPEIAVAEGDQVEARLRYDIRHDNGVDVLRLDLLQAHELRQPDCIFVGGPLRVAGATPRTAQRVAFVDGENHVRISRIDGKQHDTPYDVTGSWKNTSPAATVRRSPPGNSSRSEEHTSELQSLMPKS